MTDCTDYDACSTTCGGGVKSCERTCLLFDLTVDCPPEFDKHKSVPCDEQPCPGEFCISQFLSADNVQKDAWCALE